MHIKVASAYNNMSKYYIFELRKITAITSRIKASF